ncbi:MAG: hypothetical protein P4L45_12370, partial [Ignavibacteriaceae bacterium]|nr:hypothetical protein [Ignavibacteriaceae bacterium]
MIEEKKCNIAHLVPEVILYNPSDVFIHNISEFIQSIEIIKAVDTPVSTAVIKLNPARDGALSNVTTSQTINLLKKWLKLNSIISIKIDNRSKKHNFLGRVDHVYESTTANNGSTSRSLVVNCSLLLPKLLLRDNIINSPFLYTNKKVKDVLGPRRTEFFGWMRGAVNGKSPFAGTPEEAIKWILDNCPATNADIGLNFNKNIGRNPSDILTNPFTPKSFFPGDKKDYKGSPLLDFKFLKGEFLFNPQLATYAGTILNYIYACLDQAYYELFFDTTTVEDGLPYNTMVIRPKPFSFKNYSPQADMGAVNGWINFEDLEQITVNSSMRIQEDLGINDFELKNFFQVNFVNSLIASASNYLGKFGLQYPVINLASIKKFGLRDLTVTSTMINLEKIIKKFNDQMEAGTPENIDHLTQSEGYGEAGASSTLLGYLLAKREKIVEWYAFPYFESGQITLPGHAGFDALGKRL